MRFDPERLQVSPGQQLNVTLVNNAQEGEIEHNIEFELPDGEKELENNLKPGERGSLSFTAPQERGSYTYYCPVDDHKDKGMTGTLVVE